MAVTLNDCQLYQHYRYDRASIYFICDALHNSLILRTNRNHSLPNTLRILITLRFLATGSFLSVISDIFNVHQSTVSRIINEIVSALVNLAPLFLNFPSGQTAQAVKRSFYDLGGFPGVLGAVDCCHIRIQAPKSESKQSYICRKGYPSINVQAVADTNYMFLNIVARWTGSVNDSRIFRNSGLCSEFETGVHSGYLLGDSGYGSKHFFMTPFLKPITAAQKRYNIAHKKTRVVVEQMFGQWKRRFHCLHAEIRLPNPETICQVITACAVLHNIAKLRNLPDFGEEDTEADYEEDDKSQDDRDAQGQASRNFIVMQYFS